MPLALVEPLLRAVKDDRVTTLARTVAQLDEAGLFENPLFFADVHAEHYARRLIWKDPENRFVVVGMTWAPGQASSLHDHAGLWGVEIVVSGTIQETTYRLLERNAEGRCRFAVDEERTASRGMAGVLNPPYEYHVIANAGSVPAQTLHVYGGSFERCTVFSQEADGWWQPKNVQLGYDG